MVTKDSIENDRNKSIDLVFKDRIISTASRPIPSKNLLKSLKNLHDELSNLDQNRINLSSLETIKDSLIDKKLMRNQNNGIQVFDACCLVDILRLYAPDAPYNDSDLTSIFKLIIQQFHHLTEVDSPFYLNYVYLIEKVAEIKLVALMTDLSTKDKLIAEYFEVLYSLTIQTNFDLQSLQPLIIDILNEIINEVNHLDLKTLKLILNKFLANSRNMKNQTKIKVPGFEISLALCEINSDKLSRLITYFFSEMIIEATKNVESDIESDVDSESEFNKNSNNDVDEFGKKLPTIDLVQLKKTHNLAVELWRYVPEVLTSFMGLLDNELETEDIRIRMVATETVSKILQIKSSKINFPTTHVSTYMNWLKKPLDISLNIRLTWINGLARILESRNDINSDIVSGLLKTLIDSNDKIRLQTIVELSKLKPDIFLHNVLNDNFADTIIKLLREKNVSIRNELFQFLGTLYNVSIDNNPTFSSEFIINIPNHILSLIYINDKTVSAEIDFIIFEKIIPFNSEVDARVNRFLTVFSSLDDKSKTSLLAITKRQTQLSMVMVKLLALLEDQDPNNDSQINSAIKWLSDSFPHTFNFDQCFQFFISLNNKRLMRLMKLCVLETTDYDTIVSSTKELLNRIKDPKIVDHSLEYPNINSNILYNSIKLLLLRSSNIFYNINNIPILIQINSDESNKFQEIAGIILNDISQICPNVLRLQSSLLTTEFIDKVNKINLEEPRIYNDTHRDLKIFNNYLFKNINEFEFTKDFLEILYTLCIKGTPKEAKYSVKIINKATEARGLYFTKIVHHVWPLNIKSKHLNTYLSVLSEIFLCDLISVDHIKDDLSKILAGEILLKNQLVSNIDNKEDANDESDKWITDNDLYYSHENKECLSKILTMKLLTNWLISIKDDTFEDIEVISKPILSMLSSFINRGGEIVAAENTPYKFCTRLRAHAGMLLIKLAQISVYEKFIDQRRINRLVVLIQDVEIDVRSKFLEKLKKKLSQKKLSERFIPLIFFTAHEPDLILRSTTSTWIRASFAKQTKLNNHKNKLVFEKAYIRFLYMLFHHPKLKDFYFSFKTIDDEDQTTVINGDLSESERTKKFKELSSFALTYIVYSLSLIINSDNISLLYYLTQKIKQFEGVVLIEGSESFNDLLYYVSELAQSSIKYIGKIRNWNITTWPGNLNLPSDLYIKLDIATANETIKTLYIPDEFIEIVNEQIRVKWRRELGSYNNKKQKAKKILEDHDFELEDEDEGTKDKVKNHANIKSRKTHTRKRKKTADLGSDSDESDYKDNRYSKNRKNALPREKRNTRQSKK